MDIFPHFSLIIAAFLLVAVNGFFVASEFSLVKIRKTRIEELVQKGSRRAGIARELVSRLDEYLSTTQLGITIASLGLGWIGEPAFARLFQPFFHNVGRLQTVLAHSVAATAAFLLITFMHIVLGELAPKSLAIQRTERILLWVSAPLRWFHRISYPFIWALNGAANLSLRIFGLSPVAEYERVHSEEELRMILAHSLALGVLDREESQMLERVFEFGDRSVRQVMVPSMEVVYLDIQKSVEENLEIARTHRHTRYPLCDGALDRVLGLVHVKDLYGKYKELGPDFDLMSVRRRVQFVPENNSLKSLLADFRKIRTHLATVVDEYGSVIGIVTLEDVLEELVGEIQDEFDIEKPPLMIQKIDDAHYVVHGRTLLEDIEDRLDLPIDDEENDTIGGHVMMLLGRNAHIGDTVVVGGRFRVRVTGVKGLQITDLMFEAVKPPASNFTN